MTKPTKLRVLSAPSGEFDQSTIALSHTKFRIKPGDLIGVVPGQRLQVIDCSNSSPHTWFFTLSIAPVLNSRNSLHRVSASDGLSSMSQNLRPRSFLGGISSASMEAHEHILNSVRPS